MLSTLKRYPLPPNVTSLSLSIRRSLPKVKTKKKKIQKNLYSLYVQYIFVMEFCISEHFCEAAVPHRCR